MRGTLWVARVLPSTLGSLQPGLEDPLQTNRQHHRLRLKLLAALISETGTVSGVSCLDHVAGWNGVQAVDKPCAWMQRGRLSQGDKNVQAPGHIRHYGITASPILKQQLLTDDEAPKLNLIANH